jgi:hypothetical protein
MRQYDIGTTCTSNKTHTHTSTDPRTEKPKPSPIRNDPTPPHTQPRGKGKKKECQEPVSRTLQSKPVQGTSKSSATRIPHTAWEHQPSAWEEQRDRPVWSTSRYMGLSHGQARKGIVAREADGKGKERRAGIDSKVEGTKTLTVQYGTVR